VADGRSTARPADATELRERSRNLQATDGPTNQKKGGRDAATGLPSNKDLPHHGSAAQRKDQGNPAALNQTK
jgi:hypothetical protein